MTRIAFGSCFRETRPAPVFEAITETRPEWFVWLGDNVYGDTDDMAVLRAKYQVATALPGYSALRGSCRVIGTSDDHDFGRNDGGNDHPMRRESQHELLDFLGESADSPRRQQEGVYWGYRSGTGREDGALHFGNRGVTNRVCFEVGQALDRLGLQEEVLADAGAIGFGPRDPPRVGPGGVLLRLQLEVMDLFGGAAVRNWQLFWQLPRPDFFRSRNKKKNNELSLERGCFGSRMSSVRTRREWSRPFLNHEVHAGMAFGNLAAPTISPFEWSRPFPFHPTVNSGQPQARSGRMRTLPEAFSSNAVVLSAVALAKEYAFLTCEGLAKKVAEIGGRGKGRAPGSSMPDQAG